MAQLQNYLQWKGDVSKRLRKYTVRSGLSPPLIKKVTLPWTLKFAVALWNDWTGGQSSMIGKQCSQLHRISKGFAQCRLPCDFPVKSGSRIYFINVGIHLLMCSGFWWFLFLKVQFWGRQVWEGLPVFSFIVKVEWMKLFTVCAVDTSDTGLRARDVRPCGHPSHPAVFRRTGWHWDTVHWQLFPGQ